MDRYIFDLDGTLVPSGRYIKAEHAAQLQEFSKYNYCYLVSSGKYSKIEKQLGKELINCFDFVFSSSGNAVYKNGEIYKYEDWLLTDLMREWFIKQAKTIPYPNINIEIDSHPGCVIVYLIGEYASNKERLSFINWPLNEIERKNFCYMFNNRFPMYNACLSGNTSIEITKKNKDKQQITEYFDESDTLVFLGNKTHYYGNDYSLAKKILNNNLGHVYTIEKPQDTYDILTSIVHNTQH